MGQTPSQKTGEISHINQENVLLNDAELGKIILKQSPGEDSQKNAPTCFTDKFSYMKG